MTAGFINPEPGESELDDFFIQEVTVDTVTGEGGWGPQTIEGGPYKCFIDDSRKLVRDQAGNEVISETTITAPKEYRDYFTPGSTVHLPDRDATVITAAVAESGLLELPDHLEVTLT